MRSEPSATLRPPLEGLRVVSVEHSVAGPLCTRILADLGADVIKVERPGVGDFTRHWDGNVRGDGAQFWWLNCSKRSVALDLKSEAGAAALHALLERADVFVHNLAPASAARLGLDAEAIERRYPDLVNCQISGYGATGPARDRKAYDMLIQAESGIMSLTGTSEQPMRVGVSMSDVSTGIYSALLVLGALLGRERAGRGKTLDVAMLDVTLEMLGPMLLSFMNAGVKYERLPDRHHAIAPYGVFRCADGERVLLAIEQDSEWHRFTSGVLGDDALADDPRYATNRDRVTHGRELHELIEAWTSKLPAAEVVRRLKGKDLAYAQVNDVEALSQHTVVADRGILRQARNAAGESVVRNAGIAERLFPRPSGRRDRPPRLGEDTAEVLREIGAAPGSAAPGSAPAELEV